MAMLTSVLKNENESGPATTTYPTQQLTMQEFENEENESQTGVSSSITSSPSSIHGSQINQLVLPDDVKILGDASESDNAPENETRLELEKEQKEAEPFSIPSSPIDDKNNQSLIMMNSAYLDKTLLFEEEDGGIIKKSEQHSQIQDQNQDEDEDEDANTNEEYTVFSDLLKSQNHENSLLFSLDVNNHQIRRAPSSIISDSTTNTSFSYASSFSKRSRLRRPRPWDDEAKNNNKYQSQEQDKKEEEKQPQDYSPLTVEKNLKNSKNSSNGGERTPLLQINNQNVPDTVRRSKKKKSLWSAKTCKRKNTNTTASQDSINRIHQDRDTTSPTSNHLTGGVNDGSKRYNKRFSFPFLRWRKEPSERSEKMNNEYDETRSISLSDNVHYGSIGSNETNNNNKFLTNAQEKFHQNNQHHDEEQLFTYLDNETQSTKDRQFLSIFLLGMVMHFVLMAGYGLFLSYRAYRLGNENIDSGSTGAISWMSQEGRVYNPAIGPNAVTLYLFGVFNPGTLLLKPESEYWRMLTSITMNTSIIQLGLNAWAIKYAIWDYENRFGVKTTMCTFFFSVLSGGTCLLMSTSLFRNNGIIQITGLSSAGLTGICTSRLIEIMFNGGREVSYNRLHHKKKKGFWRSSICFFGGRSKIGLVHLCLLLEILNGIFMPYTSLSSIIGGAIMGICCGIFSFATILRGFDEDWDEVGSNTQSSVHFDDMDAAFDPIMNTPPRERKGARMGNLDDDLPPPPPPSSSSKGAVTPIMRRSILTSPEDEDDELGILQNLNLHGVGGLGGMKNRNSNYNTSYFHQDAGGPMITPRKEKFNFFKSGGTNKVGRLRFFSVCMGLLTLVLPVLLIGFVSNPPTELQILDSYYGCKTMSSIYYTSGDDNGENDDKNAAESLVCGEVCVPWQFVNQFKRNLDSDLSNTSCSNLGYSVQLFSDSLDVNGKYDVVREVYSPTESN